MRRAVALGVAGVALVAPGTARADEAVNLDVGRSVALHGTNVRFSGRATSDTVETSGVQIQIFRKVGATWTRIRQRTTSTGGRWHVDIPLMKPGPFVARATFEGNGAPIVVESAPVQVRIKPRLRSRFTGSSVVGHALYLRGRLKPAGAGVLRKTVRGVTRRVSVGRYGAFRIKLLTGNALPVRVRLHVRPATGYVAREVMKRKRLSLPYLSSGSRGRSVRALERLLKARQYAIRGTNRTYRTDTAQAVLAFQKVHGLSRTGRVGPDLWRRLARSGTPKARVPRGKHIEISKTKQVIYEVRKGKVVNVLHTSTGVTGNTPVGTWRVYSKVPGYNAVHMYYSLFFLRGFAIHGYHSVPAWPASHGCARIPIWAAPGLYGRWGYGSKIIVFA